MRRFIYLLAVCLGIPIAMSAQGSAYIEYWFDSDHAHTVRVAATYGSTSFSPDVSGLSRGFHRISYRYQAGDGKWSAPHSAIFMCNNGSYTGTWKLLWERDDDGNGQNVMYIYASFDNDSDYKIHFSRMEQ